MSHRPIKLRGRPGDPPIAMTPWVRAYASRLADVRVPEGVRVSMFARSARGPFVANVFTDSAGQVAMVWDRLPEMALRTALIVAGVATCEVCGEPDDGFHWTEHASTVRMDGGGYVREISDGHA